MGSIASVVQVPVILLLLLLLPALFTLTSGETATTASTECPKFSDLSGLSDFNCPSTCSQPSFSRQDNVYGTENYTQDSDLCVAAVHDGVINDEGGKVIFETNPQPHPISGTTRNRVVSQSRNGESKTFRFKSMAPVVSSNDVAGDVIVIHNSYGNYGNLLEITCLADDAERVLSTDDIMGWSYEDNINERNVWVFREQKTTENTKCVFPFEYDGSTYWSCPTSYFNKRWCKTTSSWQDCKAEEGRYGIKMSFGRDTNKRALICKGKTAASDVLAVIQTPDQKYNSKFTSLRGDRNDRLQISLEKAEASLPDEIFFRHFPDDWNYEEGVLSKTSLPLTFDRISPAHAGLYVMGNSKEQTWNNATRRTIEKEGAYLQVNVRDCEPDRYGPSCEGWCPDCEHGGQCHPVTGSCLCPPGYMGDTCQEACYRGNFGSKCQLTCDSYTLRFMMPDSDRICGGLTFCLPQPLGCSCAPGFTGPLCQEVCGDGRYGAGCEQECAFCKDNLCNDVNGKCTNGCRDGIPCNEEGFVLDLPRLREPPSITDVEETSAVVRFFPWKKDKDDGSSEFPPKDYLVQIKKEEESTSWITKKRLPSSSAQKITTKIEDLEEDAKYSVRVLINTEEGYVDGTTNKRVQMASFTTDKSRKSRSNVAAILVSILMLAIVLILAIVFRKKLVNASERLVAKFMRDQVIDEGQVDDRSAIVPLAVPPRISAPIPLATHLPGPATATGTATATTAAAAADDIYANVPKDPIYSNLQFDKLVSPSDLEAYLCQVINSNELSDKFHSVLPTFDKSMDYGLLPENKKKNRYKNNLPYDETRVKLSLVNDDPFSDYINANRIYGFGGALKLIATQGPKDANLNTIEDFWRMIYEQDVTAIIMVANFVEGGKSKVGEYFSYEEDLHLGSCIVHVAATQKFPKYNISIIEIISNGSILHTLTHYHYTRWPDHGVPTEAYTLGSMLRTVIQNHEEGCIVVHCSAGIGRTGTVLMVLLLHEMLSNCNGIDLLKVLKKLRESRARLVENLLQFNLSLQLFEEVEFGAWHTVQSRDLPKDLPQLLQEVPGLHRKAKSFPYNLTFSTASNPECVSMNRSETVFPADSNRVFLDIENGQGSSQYINAIKIDGIHRSSSVIVTEHPLPSMVSKFWRLVMEKKCPTIVFINSFDGLETEFPVITPLEDEQMHLGTLSLFLQVVDYSESLIQSTVKIVSAQDDLEHLVTVYQITSWQYGSDLPDSPHALLTVCDLILNAQRTPASGPTLFTCGDGVTGSGVMAGLLNLVDQMKRYHELNLYRTLLRLLRVRKEFFTSPAQLEFLCNAANCYIQTYSSDGNSSL